MPLGWLMDWALRKRPKKPQSNYANEDRVVKIGRDGTTITSPLFELDDGTTLAEVWGIATKNKEK